MPLALFAVLPLAGLFLRRRIRSLARRLRGDGPFALLLGAAVVAALGSACNCNGNAQAVCSLDDDCRLHKCEAGFIPSCESDGSCGCKPDTSMGDIGRYSSMAMRRSVAYIAAYNTTYGDLMIGHVQPPGVVTNWEFVDGVPDDAASDNPVSTVRGGITERGDDVGRYASIAVNGDLDPVVAYYDATHGALKYATFGAVRWRSHVVDSGLGAPLAGGDNFGMFASLTVGKDGRPGIAYYAEVQKGASGKRESQLRFAQASRPDPRTKADWTITTVETRVMPVPPMTNPPPQLLPEGIALFVASARKSDDGPVVAYYDRERGNLRYVEYDAVAKKWGTPAILDGEADNGSDTADAGMYPSITMEGAVAHISYVDATRDNLLYVNTKDRIPEVIDDGYHPKDEKTMDGLDSPVWHLVGDSSSIGMGQGQLFVAYQDSTTLQLRFAQRDPATKKWTLQTIAGHGTPFKGSYGFYANARVSGGVAVLSSYAINQHLDNPEFFVETFAINLGGVM